MGEGVMAVAERGVGRMAGERAVRAAVVKAVVARAAVPMAAAMRVATSAA